MRLGDDALAADNTFNFVVSPSEPLRVTLVDRGNADVYLARALAIGEAPKFEHRQAQPETVSDDDLRRSAVVVLNDVPCAALARRLTVSSRAAGCWSSPGHAPPGRRTSTCCRRRSATRWIAPAATRPASARSSSRTRSSSRSARRAAATSRPARVYGYRKVTVARRAQVLARFDAGAPAVSSGAGRGRVLLWASSLDPTWTDLPLKPVFLPFVHRAVATSPPTRAAALAHRRPGAGCLVGGARGAATQRVVLTPSGRRVPIDDEGRRGPGADGAGLLRAARRPRARATGRRGGRPNVDPAEADLTADRSEGDRGGRRRVDSGGDGRAADAACP